MINLKTLGISFIFGFLTMISTANAQPNVEQLWLTEGLSVPESVLVYRNGRTNFLLVSLIDGEPNTKDGKGGIAKMSLDGAVENAEWVTGLNAPKGMAHFDGKLYVADINELVVINIKSAEIEKKVVVPGAIFLNDVTVDSKGTVFVSDMMTGKIHRYAKNVLKDYATKLENVNGLKAIGANLVVGAGKNLYLFDSNKNRLNLASGFAQGIDGIESLNEGGFLVSCWAGLLYYVHLDGKKDVLLDSQKEGINIADIGFDSETQTVFVPNFSKNSVTAYKLRVN
jgi:sugar lactone lactonase YvrE